MGDHRNNPLSIAAQQGRPVPVPPLVKFEGFEDLAFILNQHGQIVHGSELAYDSDKHELVELKFIMLFREAALPENRRPVKYIVGELGRIPLAGIRESISKSAPPPDSAIITS